MNKKILASLAVAFLLFASMNYSLLNRGFSQMNADSMFIAPSHIDFTPDNASVGAKFNVTVWLNTTVPVNNWQVYLTFNRSQIQAIRGDYTGSGKSMWSGALPVDTVLPSIGDHNATFGYFLHGEVLKSSAELSTAGSLIWVEFNITKAPEPGQTLTSMLNLDEMGVFNSNAFDKDFNPQTVTFGNAVYRFSSGAPQVQYRLTIIAGTGGTTNPVPGDYMKDAGTQVQVTAIPDGTHTFDHWELDTVNSGSTNPITVTMNQNHTLTADFTEIIPGANFTLIITAGPGGTTEPLPGTYSFNSGTPVQVEALPDIIHLFDHWELDALNAGSTNPITVAMGQNHTLNAVFTETPPPEANFTLMINPALGGLTSPLAGNHTYPQNSNVSVQAFPESNFTFSHWELDLVNVGSQNPIVVLMNMNHTLTPVFEGAPPAERFMLMITTTTGGTTNPSPGNYTYDANTQVSVTAMPNSGFVFDHWELDGIDVGSTNPIIVTMDTNHTLHTVFMQTAPPPTTAGLTLKVSGEFDFMPWENLKIKIAAQVTRGSGRVALISGAKVTIKIFSPGNHLIIKTRMKEISKGLYVWESQKTVEKIFRHGGKGIYIAQVAAARNNETTYDMIEFHIDPPGEASIGIAQTPLALITCASAIIAALAIIVPLAYIKRKRKP